MTRPNKKNAKRSKTRAFRTRRREHLAEEAGTSPVVWVAGVGEPPPAFAATDEVAALRQRLARQEAELESERAPAVDLDDKGYEPPTVDPLRKGVARVNEITAKAAARRKAMTKYEYEQLQRRTGS